MPRAAGSASTTDSRLRSPAGPCGTGPPEAIARIAPSPSGASASARSPSSYTTASASGPSAATSARSSPASTCTRSRSRPIAVPAVRLQEPRPGRLLDVLPARLEQVAAGLVPAVGCPRAPRSCRSSLRRSSSSCRPALRQRRGLAVDLLDVGLELLALGLGRRRCARGPVVRSSSSRSRSRSYRTRGALQRLDLGAAAGGLLADAPAHVLDLAAVLVGLAEAASAVQSSSRSRARQLRDDRSTLGLDAGELLVDRVESRGAGGLRRQVLRRRRLRVDGARGTPARLGPFAWSRPNDGARPRRVRAIGGRAIVGRLQDLGVERVQPLAGPCRSASPSSQPPFRRSLLAHAARAAARPRACRDSSSACSSTARASWPSRPAAGAASAGAGARPARPAAAGDPGPGPTACARPAPCDGGAWRCRRPPRCTSAAPRAGPAAPPRAVPGRRRCAAPGRCPSRTAAPARRAAARPAR